MFVEKETPTALGKSPTDKNSTPWSEAIMLPVTASHMSREKLGRVQVKNSVLPCWPWAAMNANFLLVD